MAVSGHGTAAIFMRYNITSGDDIRQAIQRTQQYRESQPTEKNLVSFPAENAGR